MFLEDKEIERAVLGAMCLESSACIKIISLLKAEMFSVEAHRHIFAASCVISAGGGSVNVLTLRHELTRKGVLDACGGLIYVSELTTHIASAANVEYNCRLIQETYFARTLHDACLSTCDALKKPDADVFAVFDAHEQRVYETYAAANPSGASSMADYIRGAGQSLYEKDKGVTSGIGDIDLFLGGWLPGDLTIIAARPGMGKTNFTFQGAVAAARKGIPTAYFSLEMSAVQLIMRAAMAESEIPVSVIRGGAMDDATKARVTDAFQYLSSLPLYIDEGADLSVSEMRNRVKRLVKEKRVGLVYLDYLQLLNPGTNSRLTRQESVSIASRTLKIIAKENNIPIVALAQLNRQAEGRADVDKRPRLADLRDSGSIEQDADRVCFLFRGDYYGLVVNENSEPYAGRAEFIIAKNRHGDIDTIDVGYKKHIAKFFDFGNRGYAGQTSNNQSVAVAPKNNFNNSAEIDDSDLPF